MRTHTRLKSFLTTVPILLIALGQVTSMGQLPQTRTTVPPPQQATAGTQTKFSTPLPRGANTGSLSPRNKQLAITALSTGMPLFLPAVSYDSGGENPVTVAVTDLNGDGKPDLLVLNCSPIGGDDCGNDIGHGVVAVLLGKGHGTTTTHCPLCGYHMSGQFPFHCSNRGTYPRK